MGPLRQGGSLQTLLQCVQTVLFVNLSAADLLVKADKDYLGFTCKIKSQTNVHLLDTLDPAYWR